MAKTKEKKVVELVSLDAKNIKELSGWETKQKELVKENPFVKIDDNETYELAKKHRTALRTGRTEIQKQDKTIASFLRNFRKETQNIAEKLIGITQPNEDKQQAEIDVWEAELQRKREEKERIEQERIDGIKETIETTEKTLSNIIFVTKYDTIDESLKTFDDSVSELVEYDFEEFQFLFDEMIERKRIDWESNKTRLLNDEKERVERLQESQKAKMNELKLEAMELIDGMTAKSLKGDRAKLNKIFETDFDFGEFESQVNDIRGEMFTKATDKCEKIEADAELEKKRIQGEELIVQREKLFHWRFGSMESIHAMTIENHASETNRIQKEKDEIDLPLLNDDVAVAKDMIEKALKSKLEQIELELKKQREAKEQMESVTNTRLKMIKDELDIPYDFKEQAYIGKGVYIPNLDIQTKTDDEFTKLIQDCKSHIAKFPTVPPTKTDENPAAEVSEAEVSFDLDRELMKYTINNSIRMSHAPLDELKTDRGRKIWKQVTQGLEQWCDEKCESIN